MRPFAHMESADYTEAVRLPLQPVDGVSAYDYRLATYRCCQCSEPIALDDRSQALLVQQQLDERRRYGDPVDYDAVERLKKRVWTREGGEQLALNQYIHTRCLAPLSDTELERLRAKARFALPRPATHDMTDLLDYTLGGMHCAYCQIVVNRCALGVAYTERGGHGPVRYLHLACYARLAKQQQEREQQKRRLRNDVPLDVQDELGPVAARRQNVAWEAVMLERSLAAPELETYRAWRDQRSTQRAVWSEAQRQEWDQLGPDALEARERELEDVDREATERDLNDALATASYPINGELLRETRIKLNLLRARGSGPIEQPRKRKLGED